MNFPLFWNLSALAARYPRRWKTRWILGRKVPQWSKMWWGRGKALTRERKRRRWTRERLCWNNSPGRYVLNIRLFVESLKLLKRWIQFALPASIPYKISSENENNIVIFFIKGGVENIHVSRTQISLLDLIFVRKFSNSKCQFKVVFISFALIQTWFDHIFSKFSKLTFSSGSWTRKHIVYNHFHNHSA